VTGAPSNEEVPVGFENGHLLRVVLRATAGSEEQVNTFHYDLIDDVAEPANDPQALADRFRDDVRPHWIASMSSAWTFDPVHIVDEFDPIIPFATRSSWDSGAPAAGTKTLGSDLLPRNMVPVASLRTAHIGRRFRGRLWMMGSYTEGEQVDGAWTSGSLTSLQTVLDFVPFQPDIAGGISTSVANWCVYSRTMRAEAGHPYANKITSATVTPLLHSLRSRARYS